MNITETQSRTAVPDDSNVTARSHRVTTVAWLTGVTAVCAFGMFDEIKTLGGGIAAAAACGMVGFVCHSILKYP